MIPEEITSICNYLNGKLPIHVPKLNPLGTYIQDDTITFLWLGMITAVSIKGILSDPEFEDKVLAAVIEEDAKDRNTYLNTQKAVDVGIKKS